SAGIEYSLQDEEKTTSLSNLKEESDKEAAQKAGEQTEMPDAEGVSVGSLQVGGFSDLVSTADGISRAPEKKILDTVVVSEGYTR
ncbi:hypothetical protein, partial [Streptomyces brasiliscabiei]|uniref:hypothetical protein n=1 Tax=Streptomyces brasiliscabiei TaxID=2736302 RepID=UPI0030156904